MIIGTECSGYFRRRGDVRPGKFVRKPCARAAESVENVGKNNAACANATRSAGVATPMAAFAQWGTGSGLGNDRCHSLVVKSRCPVRRMVSSREMVMVSVVKTVVHPESQNWPMDNSVGQVRLGTMWT